MSADLRQIQPPSAAAPAANYALAMLAESPKRLLTTSGIVPTAADGSVPPDIAEQAQVVWDSISEILKSADMSFSNIMSVSTWVVDGPDTNENLQKVMRARDEKMRGHKAASTLVIVPKLAKPEWLMEISIIAAD